MTASSLFNDILDRGTQIHYVAADAASELHRGAPYAYTIGRSMAGRPELLITGLDAEAARAILEHVAQRDESAPRPLAAGDVTPWIDGKQPFKVIEAEPGILSGALLAFGIGRVTALQLLWPDAHGRYPDADGDWITQTVHAKGGFPFSPHVDPYQED